MDFKNMFKIVKKVSKKAKKPAFIIFIDMIYCGLVYGAGYYDYQEFEFYLIKKKYRKTYLTRSKNNSIVKAFNDPKFFIKFDDKVIFNNLFKKYLKRDYLVINKTNYQEFVEFTNKHKELIVKPVNETGGTGIEKLIINDSSDLKKLFDNLINKNQLLVEESVKQHENLNQLYNKSVNTLRLYTFYNGHTVYVLNSVFKIGNGGVIDNFSSGGMYTFVNENGKVMVPAIDQDDNIYATHPISKKTIIDFKVPLYEEACAMVKEAARIIPQVKYVGWDIAIGPDGPILIEGNCFPGVYQIKPSLTTEHVGLIPKYKKVMKIK